MASRFAWNPGHDNALRKMASEGLDRATMSERLGKSPAAITERMKRLGLEHANKQGVNFTHSERETIRGMAREGATAAMIAKRLPGRTAKSILAKAKAMNVRLMPGTLKRPRKSLEQIIAEESGR